jgi:putative membrane protein
MPMRILVAISLLAFVAAAPGLAQQTGTGNPATVAPGMPQAAPGMPAANQPNQNDSLFVREATIGGKAEVELGQLAEQKGRPQGIKDFARQMVTDHGKANEQLTQLAQKANITQPHDFDEEHKAMRAQLDKLSGREFDLAYIRGQIGDHQKTAQLFEWEIGSGQDPQLKTFASQVLPIVLQHLEMARAVEYQLAATAATPAAGRRATPDASRPPAR